MHSELEWVSSKIFQSEEDFYSSKSGNNKWHEYEIRLILIPVGSFGGIAGSTVGSKVAMSLRSEINQQSVLFFSISHISSLIYGVHKIKKWKVFLLTQYDNMICKMITFLNIYILNLGVAKK